MIKLFDAMNNGSYVNHPSIEYVKTKAFIFQPGMEVTAKKSSKSQQKAKGVLTIDGESVDYVLTAVENFQGLANVFCPPPRRTIPLSKK